MASLKDYEIKRLDKFLTNRIKIDFFTAKLLQLMIADSARLPLMLASYGIIVAILSVDGASVRPQHSDGLFVVTAQLFSDRVYADEEFDQILAKATSLGASKQTLLEARIAHYWEKGDFPKLIALLPQIEGRLEKWDIPSSQIFQSLKELKGYYYLFRALEAGEKDQAANFETYTKESFWNHPELAEVLTFLIQEHRGEASAFNPVVPMDLAVLTSQGGSITLGELVEDKKGILLDFWASWCHPCMILMTDLVEKAEKLEPQGLVVAGMNMESISKAESVRKKRKVPYPWLVEPKGEPLSRLLAINSLPRMVLISSEGKVLFNGHPLDPNLKSALAKLDVAL